MFPRHLPEPPARRPPPTPAPVAAPAADASDVRDWLGRRYTVGPSARELTGLSRPALLLRILLAAAAVGVLQFGYGAAVPVLIAAHGWSPAQALVPFLVWALVQGSFAPVPRLLGARGPAGPGAAILLGTALCAAALYTVGHASDPLAAAAGYGLLGGAGAGLVYHSCADLVEGWFPDRHTVRLGAVGGAFALGPVPLLPALVLGLSPESLAAASTALALGVLALGAAGGIGQRGAPAHWWPPERDPRAAALRRSADPPAARDFSAGQAWASGRSLPALHTIVALSGAVGLFTLVALPALALGLGRDPTEVATVITAFALASGLGRLAASVVAERAGRRRTLAVLLAATALGQAGLAAAIQDGPLPLLVCLGLVVGVGTGSCYPLTRAITEGHFGAGRHGGPGHPADLPGLVHGSKAVGGLLGVGGAIALLSLVPAGSHAAYLAVSALLPASAAVLAARLRRPLPIRTLPHGVWTAGRRSAPM
ncbi:MFS transporter [Nocardiopsis changdeensis]|uniref:MFS transporter n=1 Tax=Nocardiopsis changdeensis TaxID=2831969 RepID=A0ABX8BTL1_9ACTN|nr:MULTISPECIES: MFS transporter [Nocardiopsis]QUX25030.1 MFS transporter [Nocardiopsis changdeensis]QYX35416.1 MFS transporter [Nocardiopsis sp. MT53]